MTEETTKPARVPATPFFILKDLHTAREEEARAKEAERAARIDERRAARIEDDKKFIDLGDLRNSIVDRHGLKPGDASRMMAMALEIDGAPLFCRWFDHDQPYYPDGVLWALLPAGPVSLIKEDTLSWDQYDNLVAAPKGDGADIYDPLNSAVLFGGLLPRDLAIRREDACRLFGLADHELIPDRQPAQAPAQPQEDADEVQEVDTPVPSASAPAGADPEPVAAPAGRGRVVHRVVNRAHRLDGVIAAARRRATGSDWLALWCELVRMAQSPDRPAPLLGYTPGEGLKLQTDGPGEVEFYRKDAFRKLIRNRNKG